MIAIKPITLTLLALCLVMAGCTSLSPGQDDSDQTSKAILAADANIQLGMNFLSKSDVSDAKQKLLDALQVAPKYPPAWYTMAYYFEVTGQRTLADSYYRKAIDLSPISGDSLNNYGTFLCHSGQAQASLAYFVKATQDPNYVDGGGALENAGLCALLIPDAKLAQSYFSKAVQRDPKRSRSWSQLAAIDYQQGQYANAKIALQHYFLRGTPTPETLLLAINITRQLDGPSAAAPYVRQLQRQFPNSLEAKQV